MNSTLLCNLPPHNAVKARPLNVEELILAGGYKRRLDPNSLYSSPPETSALKDPPTVDVDTPAEPDEIKETEVVEIAGADIIPGGSHVG